VIAHRLALNEEGLAVDLDPVAGAQIWDLCRVQVDVGGFRPEAKTSSLGRPD